MRTLGRFLLLIGALCGGTAATTTIFLLLVPPAAAAAPQVGGWEAKDFNTMDDVTRFLNTLRPERAVEAKLLVAPSNRNPIGWAGSPYRVYFRQELR